jgi:hypothetical protein
MEDDHQREAYGSIYSIEDGQKHTKKHKKPPHNTGRPDNGQK